ncbi:MAG: type II toxin-antitoxin system Phd/YefM family antitoxin [Saccharospirillum sp.]
MEATTKDLRLHTKSVLSATARGEEVIITYRGKPCAMLVPLAAETPAQNTNPLFGLWQDVTGGQEVDDLVRTLRQPRRFS